ncbi:hypothetical protein M569_06621, partial [Genlisea aurea]
DFITKLLFVHNGPVHKFSISTPHLNIGPEIDQWLLFVSRKDIRELVIELKDGSWITVPSCIFSCDKLTRLELSMCQLDIPPNFSGFPFLKYLKLMHFYTDIDDLDNLISSSPCLESLELTYPEDQPIELRIRAEKLKSLYMEGDFINVFPEHTPCLVIIVIDMLVTDDDVEGFKNCDFEKFLQSVPKLERIVGRTYFTRFLSLCNKASISSLQYAHTTQKHVKMIELCGVGFHDFEEVLVVLRLIRSCPNLKSLKISVSTDAVDAIEDADMESLWDEDSFSSIMWSLDELKSVEFTDLCGVNYETEFIKFVLMHSPRLEEFVISPSNEDTDLASPDKRFDFFIRLLAFKRASPNASILF